MKNAKSLGISVPWVSGYPATGHLLAILQSHEELHGWLFCNYIQLFSASDNHIDYFDICMDDCPFFSYNYVDKEWIFRLISIREFVIMMINEGYYLTMMVNTAKIAAYDFNGVHDPLIYGYDLDNDIVYLADHFKNGKYSFDICSFEELTASLCLFDFDFEKRFEQVYSRITLMKYDSSLYRNYVKLYYDYDNRFLFDIDICRKSLQDYLSGFPTRNWHTRLTHMSKEEESKHYFGIRCYELILRQIDITWKEEQLFSGIIQSAYVVYSHKLMMCKRIEYMMNKGLLENGELHYDVWNELTVQAKIVLWFLVKCDAATNFDFSSKDKLYRRIESMRQNEIKEIEKFLIDLRN